MKLEKRKPRNFLVPLSLKRKAGWHEKTEKAIRKAQKVELRKVCNSVGQSNGLLPRESRVQITPHLPETFSKLMVLKSFLRKCRINSVGQSNLFVSGKSSVRIGYSAPDLGN